MGKNTISRRTFIFGTAIMAAGCATTGGKKVKGPRKISANEKLNIAGCGCGGKGSSDIDGAAEGADHQGNCQGFCPFRLFGKGAAFYIRPPGHLGHPDPVKFFQERGHESQCHGYHHGHIM
jgi:hypothetical protein